MDLCYLVDGMKPKSPCLTPKEDDIHIVKNKKPFTPLSGSKGYKYSSQSPCEQPRSLPEKQILPATPPHIEQVTVKPVPANVHLPPAASLLTKALENSQVSAPINTKTDDLANFSTHSYQPNAPPIYFSPYAPNARVVPDMNHAGYAMYPSTSVRYAMPESTMVQPQERTYSQNSTLGSLKNQIPVQVPMQVQIPVPVPHIQVNHVNQLPSMQLPQVSLGQPSLHSFPPLNKSNSMQSAATQTSQGQHPSHPLHLSNQLFPGGGAPTTQHVRSASHTEDVSEHHISASKARSSSKASVQKALNDYISVMEITTGSKNDVHTKVRQYACQYCGRCFARKSDLVRHIQIHLGIKPNVCEICGKQFIQKSALTVHRRVHTGEKPYQCKVCGRAFSDSSSLARHRRIHARDGQFSRSLKQTRSKGKLEGDDEMVPTSDGVGDFKTID